MAEFDRWIKKAYCSVFTSKEEFDSSMGHLVAVKEALEEAVSHYGNRELLDDYSQPWYSNAREHYENKLDKVDELITKLNEKFAALPTKEELSKLFKKPS